MKPKSPDADRRGTRSPASGSAAPASPAAPAADAKAAAAIRIVRCPSCGGDSVYAPSNPSRPFCSERCRAHDFGAWASEEFRVPDPVPPDDQPFGDARLQ